MARFLLSLIAVCEAHNGNAFHEATNRVPKELTSRLQSSVDTNLVFRCHEEVTGLGRVVRRLLGDVIALGSIGVVPPASECFAEDRIEWLLDAPVSIL